MSGGTNESEIVPRLDKADKAGDESWPPTPGEYDEGVLIGWDAWTKRSVKPFTAESMVSHTGRAHSDGVHG